MKQIFFLIAFTLVSALPMKAQSLFTLDSLRTTPIREVRAMWLTTLKGLDWPKQKAITIAETEKQKLDLCNILDQLQSAGINTVLFQSRIRSTTAYPSAIEPWDGIFTGVPGKAPLYDPLQFAIDECHRRNMELHAWVVAYPICDRKNERLLGRKALPRKRPELCQRCGDKWMMDPGVPGTDQYIADICSEIVTRYDVDGIHLDYIRYPEKGIPFNDNRTYRKYGKGKNKNKWRSENVTRTVQKIHDAVKSVRPWIKISCSPIGKYADLTQQSSYGWNARDAVHQHAQEWLRKGLMDMLLPMLYFDGKHFYPFIQDWQEHNYGRQIVPGLGIYLLDKNQKNWELDAIRRQMFFSRQLHAAGQAHFRSMFFTNNVKGLYDFTKNDFYQKHVLTPAMTWEDSIAPNIPETQISIDKNKVILKWTPTKDNHPNIPVAYNVYYCDNDTFNIHTAQPLAYGIKEYQYSLLPALPTRRRGYYAVTAIDAFGNESLGKPISAYVNIPRKRMVHNLDEIEVPHIDGTEYLLITDIAGRLLQTRPYTKRISIKSLQPGYYELRTLGKKGKSHHLLRFWKE